MVFSSITFLFIFLPVILVLYYIIPDKFKNVVMLSASLIFYAWGEPLYVIFLILSILFNYVCGLDIGAKQKDLRKAKLSLVFAVTVNICFLGFFKYYGFLMDSLNAVLPVNIPYRELPLPIGISIYILQAISYLVDVYRREAEPQKNILHLGLYISMFPQLTAGPIVRYIHIEEQLKRRTLSTRRFGQGAVYFITGLGKKVILANSAGNVFEHIWGLQAGHVSVLTAWIGCISFGFQIYFELSGYSDMAMGLAKMFGFEFPKNFDYPYTASSISGFWKRWHISLGNWFREYVYIPLGTGHQGRSRQVLNLLIVWMLIGFWYGDSWTFLFWGLYYGILLIMERFWWGRSMKRMPSVVRHIYTMALILIGWVFFFSPSLGAAVKYMGVMFGPGASGFIDKQAFFYVTTHWLLYLTAILGSSTAGYRGIRYIIDSFEDGRAKKAAASVIYIGIFLISIAYLVTEPSNSLLYFKF
ncbi:MBOAT family O-acyltransferase [Muricomes intestini]|jgi:alginate O-acetyltransferase complex protein AlgI|uniref:Alginate O-acetyltransferase complex protein AlgI n=1 Tax=Muricomes intestini TaxID=1796634 RepID=A0A4R3K3C4_9FIRM|nr:MBOAT family O-acyltransferase [Muricomes intestini]TCS77190.1 alginate O-acetyltransferase complex protein AlgI [Muricomes intestini]HAX51684.1 transcriptional regulator [Lachnospiraceae bacterium]HCR82281.1 transcriptional regulator [Lachnospiraceae bacterium]